MADIEETAEYSCSCGWKGNGDELMGHCGYWRCQECGRKIKMHCPKCDAILVDAGGYDDC